MREMKSRRKFLRQKVKETRPNPQRLVIEILRRDRPFAFASPV
jgi:hypothetical protein